MYNRLDAAEVGQLSDVTTTAIGLSQGFTEMNPIGIGTLPLKYATNKWAEEQYNCTELKPIISGFGWGAGAFNTVMLLGGGYAAIPIGLAAGVAAYKYLPGNEYCINWLGKKVVFSNQTKLEVYNETN